MNCNRVGISRARQKDFVHVHPSEFVLTAAGKGICIFIATGILTQEFYDFLSKRYFFIGGEIDLVETILTINQGNSMSPLLRYEMNP